MLGFGKDGGGRAPELAGVEVTGELERVTLWHHVDGATPGLLFLLKGHSQPFRATRVSEVDTLSQAGDKVKFRTIPAGPGEAPYIVSETFKNETLRARTEQPDRVALSTH